MLLHCFFLKYFPKNTIFDEIEWSKVKVNDKIPTVFISLGKDEITSRVMSNNKKIAEEAGLTIINSNS